VHGALISWSIVRVEQRDAGGRKGPFNSFAPDPTSVNWRSFAYALPLSDPALSLSLSLSLFLSLSQLRVPPAVSLSRRIRPDRFGRVVKKRWGSGGCRRGRKRKRLKETERERERGWRGAIKRQVVKRVTATTTTPFLRDIAFRETDFRAERIVKRLLCEARLLTPPFRGYRKTCVYRAIRSTIRVAVKHVE